MTASVKSSLLGQWSSKCGVLDVPGGAGMDL
jgi:hypothetical protein